MHTRSARRSQCTRSLGSSVVDPTPLIKTRVCPHCGDSQIVRQGVEVGYDRKIRVHCNGERWEFLEFSCGLRINWIPNFSNEELVFECRNEPMFKEQMVIKQKLIADLCETIRTRKGIGQKFRDELVDSLTWRVR